jgi:hypothetical protein
VQLGAGSLRQRLVGRIADENVAEAESVFALEFRPLVSHELLSDERLQACAELGLAGEERT